MQKNKNKPRRFEHLQSKTHEHLSNLSVAVAPGESLAGFLFALRALVLPALDIFKVVSTAGVFIVNLIFVNVVVVMAMAAAAVVAAFQAVCNELLFAFHRPPIVLIAAVEQHKHAVDPGSNLQQRYLVVLEAQNETVDGAELARAALEQKPGQIQVGPRVIHHRLRACSPTTVWLGGFICIFLVPCAKMELIS